MRYAGTWGSAQVSGALHQLRSLVLVDGTIPDTEYGFAVTGQFNINLPMLATGDVLWLAATYADGALGYLGFGSSASVGGVARNVVDGFVVDGEIESGEGWQIAAGLRHNWTPTIRQNIFGSYAQVSYGADIVEEEDFNEWRVGTNVLWSPVAGLTLGVEALYANIDPRGEGTPSGDIWEGRFRVQRDF